MKEVSYSEKQVLDFIKAQPDERPIDFGDAIWSSYDSVCGCLLVHLVLDSEISRVETISCGFNFADGNSMEGRFRFGIAHQAQWIVEKGVDNQKKISTYKDLKEMINYLAPSEKSE